MPFVYDNTALPADKSDLRPRTAPVAKSLSAAEWNTVMAAIIDLRTAVLTGNYHGLISDPAVTVSPAAGVKMRNNAGVLQASENAGAYRRLGSPEVFDVRDYGALVSATDNTNAVAFQAAITAAEAVGGTVLIPAGTWTILTELRISGRVNIVGAGMAKTILLAGTSMRSVLYVYFTVEANTAQVSHLTLDGNLNAMSACYCFTAAFMRFDAVRFVRAKKDGCRLAAVTRLNYTAGTNAWTVGQVVTGGTSGSTGIIDRITGTESGGVWSGYIDMETISTTGNFTSGENLLTGAVIRATAGSSANASANDKMRFTDCWMDRNGKTFRTSGIGAIAQNLGQDIVTAGTLSTTISSDQVVGVSTVFTTMGIRKGDILRVGTSGNMEFLQILSVQDDTHLTLTGTSLAGQTRGTQPFSIGVGDGYHEDNSSENNINHISGGLYRGNSGVQMMFNGLYGPRVEHCQIDYVPSYAVCVNDGTADKTVASSSFTHMYVESVLGGGFFFDAAQGVTIDGLLGGGVGSAYNGIVTTNPPRWRVTNDDRVTGVYLAGGGVTTDDAVEGIGGALCQMSVMKTGNQRLFSVNGSMQLIQDTAAAVVAGTAITPTRSHRRFDLGGNVTMTATPSIVTTGDPGRTLLLTNGHATYSLTLQDEGTLGSSGLVLGRPTLTIGPAESALFILQVNNKWHLLAHTGNRIASATLEGIVTAGTQTFGGNKTFNGDIRQASGYFRGASTAAGFVKIDDSAGSQLVYDTATLALVGAGLTLNVIANLQGGFGTSTTDGSGTPGAVTINKTNGRAAIAIGAASVVVTNSMVAAADTVLVTALGRDATCVDLLVTAVAAGSFTVAGVANATAATPFMFTVIKST